MACVSLICSLYVCSLCDVLRHDGGCAGMRGRRCCDRATEQQRRQCRRQCGDVRVCIQSSSPSSPPSPIVHSIRTRVRIRTSSLCHSSLIVSRLTGRPWRLTARSRLAAAVPTIVHNTHTHIQTREETQLAQSTVPLQTCSTLSCWLPPQRITEAAPLFLPSAPSLASFTRLGPLADVIALR